MRTAHEPPRSQRVYLLLRDRIVSGELPEGARLPSEAALTQEYEVSRVTVRRALDQLAAEGLLDKRAGSGSFARRPRLVRPVTADLSNAMAALKEMGRRTTVRLLSFDYIQPPARVAEHLSLAPGEVVQRSVRVRSFDGEPFSHLTAFVPERIARSFTPEDLSQKGLLELIEREGVAVDHAWQEIGAVLAGVEVAEALGIDVGVPLTSLTRVVSGPNHEGLEFLQALYRPDRFSLRMELTREEGADGRHWSPVADTDPKSWATAPEQTT